ncbi:MAG: TRAM domain-containing protein, partial [Planctomycetota bacterium]
HTAARNQQLVGSVQEILVEGPSKVAGRMSGRTVHHRIVHFDSTDLSLVGRYVPVRVHEALGHSLVGERLADDHAEVIA